MKTQSELWRLIESAEWQSDHDYERINSFFKKELNEVDLKQLEDFANEMSDDLYDKFEKDWLGKPGIKVSDDSWMDLRAEVVGRGEEFYKNITADKLREMAKKHDFEENFLYSFDSE